MSVLFMANVGNSDLEVEGVAREELPREARLLAERINAARETYWPRVRLPILTKALDYVLAQKETIETVILFVSDQDRRFVGEEEWAKDTCELGKLVRAKLMEQYAEQGWRSKQVRLHTVAGNPADYGTTLAYYEAELPRILSFYDPPPARVYLSLTGGTPAMNAMLLVVGNEVLSARAVNLYDSRERKQPFPLGVGRRLARRTLRVALRTNLQTYQYAAALALVEEKGSILVDSRTTGTALAALLTYARDRLAFNFGDAAQDLNQVFSLATGLLKDRLLYWQNQILSMSESDRLRELYFSAEIKRLNHAYAGWLERVFRFQEGALRQAAVEHGVLFRDANREYVDMDWVAACPGLAKYLAQVPNPGGGRGLNPRRSTSRPLLRALLAYLAEREGDDSLVSFLMLSDRLEGLAKMRNNWVHRSQGVRRADVEESFGGSLEEAAGTLAQMLELLTGTGVEDNPYDAINDLCLDLIDGGGS
jgi:hypothetical protein